MKKMKHFTIIGFVILLNPSLKGQISLPYYSGFDNTSQQTGWTEYKKAATTFSHWGYSPVGAYSPPNCIGHDYSPSTGITLTDNWYVSPAFSISSGGILDSIRYKFSGFSQPAAGDTVAIYLLNGSQDPSLATSKQLLYDFRNTEYITDNTYRVKTNINLPTLSGLSYLAIRYRNTNCSSNWLTVHFDNIAISSGTSVGINNLENNSNEVVIYPNPVNRAFSINYANNTKSIRVLNELGQVIKTFSNLESSQTKEIDLSDVLSGIYFVEIITTEKTFTKKIIRQ